MVLPGERDYMDTEPERSKTLHNFTLPNLKWGSQRHLRCMKIKSASSGRSGGGDHRLRRRSSPLNFEYSSEAIPVWFGDAEQRSNNQHRQLRTASSRSAENGSEEGIEEFREKIMSDLRTVADKMTESIFRKEALNGEDDNEQIDAGGRVKDGRKEKREEKKKEKQKERNVSPEALTAAASSEARPWNLRTRRAACKAPIHEAGNANGSQYNSVNQNKGLRIEERRVTSSPSRNDSAKSPRERERGGVVRGETKERPKFSLPLTRKEIEEDFMELLGHRPPRRPKKRPKTVQKQLDFLFPGVYLTEVTHDDYKVPEAVEHGKR